MKSLCPLCGTRKARRACPGTNQVICAVCCGTKRLTEIACPPDCVYLASARTHPAAVIQRQQARDLEFVVPRISDLTEAQYRLFLFLQATVLQHAKGALPAPHDNDVAEAAATVAATLETARKGIIYEHRAASIPAQRLATEIGRAIADLAKRAGSETARLERDAATALRRLERAARETAAHVPDPSSPESSWLALATRMMGGAAAAAGESGEEREDAPADQRRIVLP
jgi:hypothetical protein